MTMPGSDLFSLADMGGNTDARVSYSPVSIPKPVAAYVAVAKNSDHQDRQLKSK
jgi:hypothetical protein